MKIIALLLSLSLLVITHEFGHLGFAKLFKTRVRRFYLFFNWKFSLLKAKKFDGRWHFLFFNAETPKEWEEKEPDNTLWGIGWVPLGGYCDIAGMIDETKGADQMETEPQPWEYRSKKPWQRLCIISGGVLVNFISALLIYTCIFAHWGKDELPMRNATLGYEYHQILLDEGFKNGDIIWSIDGTEMTDFAETQQKIILDKPHQVVVKRNVHGTCALDTVEVDSAARARDSMLCAVGDPSKYIQVFDTIYLSDSILARVYRQQPKQWMGVRTPFVVKDFVAGSIAKKAGIQPGDNVIAVNGEPTPSYTEIAAALAANKGKTITVGFLRHTAADSVATGTYMEVPIALGNDGKIGVLLKTPLEIFNVKHIDYNFFQAIPAGISYGWSTLASYVSSLKVIFTKEGAQSLGGFGTLGSLFPKTWDWYSFWSITAFLAIILAFMNIIPSPGLEGGHILFTLWEIVTRRKPSDKFLEVAQTVGMCLLFALLILANGNDLMRWIKEMF